MMYSLPKAMLIPLFLTTVAVADGLPVAPNGIPLVQGYRDWQLIAPSSRPDKEQVRAILGNDAAVRALRGGKRPFPDGTILVKIAWSAKKHPSFPDALVPDRFAQVEFMIKDAAKYRATGGWGFARFVGDGLVPYGKTPDFVQECFGCHTPVAGNDFVFTDWGKVPSTPN